MMLLQLRDSRFVEKCQCWWTITCSKVRAIICWDSREYFKTMFFRISLNVLRSPLAIFWLSCISFATFYQLPRRHLFGESLFLLLSSVWVSSASKAACILRTFWRTFAAVLLGFPAVSFYDVSKTSNIFANTVPPWIKYVLLVVLKYNT